MKTPTYCVVPGLGRCKVLAYLGNDRFRVLRLKTDSTYRIPRERITFLKEKSA